MATTTRTRVVQAHQVVFDQVEILQADLFTRVLGLTVADVSLVLTHNNVSVDWPLLSGVGVTDALVSSGQVYWNELSSGAYGLRFFPNALGTWILEVSYPVGTPAQRITVTYDAFNPPPVVDSLRATL